MMVMMGVVGGRKEGVCHHCGHRTTTTTTTRGSGNRRREEEEETWGRGLKGLVNGVVGYHSSGGGSGSRGAERRKEG